MKMDSIHESRIKNLEGQKGYVPEQNNNTVGGSSRLELCEVLLGLRHQCNFFGDWHCQSLHRKSAGYRT